MRGAAEPRPFKARVADFMFFRNHFQRFSHTAQAAE